MKPGDFMLGVLDFFAIMLPGSLATWLVLQYIPAPALLKALSFGAQPSTPERYVLIAAFLLSSFMLGHFAFMAGAELDPAYDRWRRRAKPFSGDRAYLAARKLQQARNQDLVGGDFTTLKWARAYIQIKSAAARVEIDRLEADQKFFRSLVVISSAFALHFLLREASLVAALAALALAVLAYHRYRDQRWKMTELIFATAVIVDAAVPATPAASLSPKPEPHA
jgi:hypothetical protein